MSRLLNLLIVVASLAVGMSTLASAQIRQDSKKTDPPPGFHPRPYSSLNSGDSREEPKITKKSAHLQSNASLVILVGQTGSLYTERCRDEGKGNFRCAENR